MSNTLFVIGVTIAYFIPLASAGTYLSEALSTGNGVVDISFKDCGADDATVTALTPNSLTLGQSQAFTGSGTNKKSITGGTFKMSMTGVGGVSLLGKCTGDLSTPASCNIGVGPFNVGKLSYGGLKFPIAPGALSMPDVTTISLPSALPKFALSTTTRLEAVDQDGASMICLEMYSKASAVEAAPGEDAWHEPVMEAPVECRVETSKPGRTMVVTNGAGTDAKVDSFSNATGRLDRKECVQRLSAGKTVSLTVDADLTDEPFVLFSLKAPLGGTVELYPDPKKGFPSKYTLKPPTLESMSVGAVSSRHFVDRKVPNHCDDMTGDFSSEWYKANAWRFTAYTASGKCPSKFNFVNKVDHPFSGYTHRTMGMKA